MSLYQHILVGIDLHAHCDNHVIMRARALVEANQSKFSLIHAVEHLNAYGAAEAYTAVLDVEEQLIHEAKQRLQEVSETHSIPMEDIYLEIGSAKSAILAKAEELHVDLIVVGSHGRHGWQLLLGSTASAVLHHAMVDVLAVRVNDK